MFTSDSITAHLAYLEANGASPATIRTYGSQLRNALVVIGATENDWDKVALAMAAYLTAHRRSVAPKTTSVRLAAFRSWALWAGAPQSFLADYRRPTPAPPQPHPIPDGMDGVRRMAEAADDPSLAALVALTGMMGLRVGEAIQVRPPHFAAAGDSGALALEVRGKGDKTRWVPVPTKAWTHLRHAFAWAVAHDNAPLVPLQDRAARRALTRLAQLAGCGKRVSSHDMRATFATHLYRSTKDLRLVQDVLGHSKPETTVVYTAVDRDDIRAAVEAL